LTGKNLDYLIDCQLEYVEFVLANEDNAVTNTMNARTFPAICLGPVGNARGSYYFMNLLTWEVVKRRSWKALPLPNEMIRRINARANQEKVLYKRDGLRFRIGETELFDEDEYNSDFENEEKQLETSVVGGIEERTVNDQPVHNPNLQDETIRDDEQINDINEEVDYEPHYWQEDYEEVAPKATHNYNLRKTRQRELWKDKFGLHAYHHVLTTFTPKKAIIEFGDEAEESMLKEMSQLHHKGVFEPIRYETLTPKQKVRILRSLMFLKRKRTGLLKSRFCANGSIQIRSMSAVDPSSPTVSAEALFITAAIDAYEKRSIATVDVEGAYLHCDMVGEVLMRIDKVPADILCKVDPKYKKFQCEDGSIVVILKKALYGCIESARLFYENVSKTLLDFGFVKNDYDPCVFNRTVYGKQCTIVIHVDDLKISCADSRGVDDVVNELKRKYGNINIHREEVIDYLGMDFDYSKKGVVSISMNAMVDQVIEEMEVAASARTPASNDLFHVDEKSPFLDKERKEKFHSIVAKLLYMAKRARPDILTAVSFLTTRCTCSTEQDWNKLVRIAKYLYGTRDLSLRLTASDKVLINSYIDASFACHKDGKSHTGEMITLGGGAVFCRSSKQKLVTKSSTEAELVGLSDGLSHVLWTKNFLQSQGYANGPAIIHQDNKSTITLAEKGKSTSNRTRHISIKYFFIKDQMEKKEVQVVYTSTDKLHADFFSKPLQGHIFESHRDVIMNKE